MKFCQSIPLLIFSLLLQGSINPSFAEFKKEMEEIAMQTAKDF